MAVFTALAIASLAVSAYSSVKAGKAQKAAGKAEHAAADSQAEIIDYNAGVADLQSADALERGQAEEQRYRQGVRTLIGSQRAGYASSGVDVTTGSAVDVQADTAALAELDALTIQTNAGREAWGYKVQAADLRKRAEVTRKTGVNAEKAGNSAGNAAYLAGAGNVLAGAGNLVAARYGYK